MTWFKREPIKPDFLKPGECECGHGRCFHKEGKYACNCAISEDDDGKRLPKEEWGSCACTLYIPDDDDDDGHSPDTPVDPEVAELERLVKA